MRVSNCVIFIAPQRSVAWRSCGSASKIPRSTPGIAGRTEGGCQLPHETARLLPLPGALSAELTPRLAQAPHEIDDDPGPEDTNAEQAVPGSGTFCGNPSLDRDWFYRHHRAKRPPSPPGIVQSTISSLCIGTGVRVGDCDRALAVFGCGLPSRIPGSERTRFQKKLSCSTSGQLPKPLSGSRVALNGINLVTAIPIAAVIGSTKGTSSVLTNPDILSSRLGSIGYFCDLITMRVGS